MKSLLWLLVVAGAAVALAVLGRADSGYVLFFYPPWRVEMSMVFFAIAASSWLGRSAQTPVGLLLARSRMEGES